ncbi:DUF4142 domain-containing protein [Nocardia mexicana]|uniref:Putative membrane protein n=1 Tax=Nocardia mexicana TaxID=279262 RepID=A0A370HFT1_9NOCA|nr:DUF4142 domain-containing protein [Nocardia mexicana]RDI55875.1 putative membrane protein [Nocardia mexicana]
MRTLRRIPLRRVLTASASVLLLGSGAAGVAGAEPAATPVDRDFLMTAHQSHMAEIAMGGRASAMASCREVQELAPTLIADHTRLDGMVTSAAARNGVALPVLPTADQAQTFLGTAPKTGRDFDIAWLQAQEQGHTAARRNAERELAAGGSPDVRGVAEQSAPLIEEHLEEVREALAEC